MSKTEKPKGRPKKYLTDAEKVQADRESAKRSNEKYYAKMKQLREMDKAKKALEKCESITKPLVGWQYHNDPISNEQVYLELEPDNKFDPNAIKVLAKKDKRHIGYIRKEDIDDVKSFMSKIQHAIVVECHKFQKRLFDLIFIVSKEKSIYDMFYESHSNMNSVYKICGQCKKKETNYYTAPYCPKCWEYIENGETW
jgi:hypothetical protein